MSALASSAVLLAMAGVSCVGAASASLAMLSKKMSLFSSGIFLLGFALEVVPDEGEGDAGEAAAAVFPDGAPRGVRQVGHAHQVCSAEAFHAADEAVQKGFDGGVCDDFCADGAGDVVGAEMHVFLVYAGDDGPVGPGLDFIVKQGASESHQGESLDEVEHFLQFEVADGLFCVGQHVVGHAQGTVCALWGILWWLCVVVHM